MRIAPLILLVFCLPAGRLSAQSPEREVVGVVQRLFDGMRAGDSAAVRSVFDSTARFMAAIEREGRPVLQTSTVDGFVRAIGTPHDSIWDERIWDTEVRVDANLASVWTKYAFYVGPRFSHCGVDHFLLFRRPAGWKIIHLADTRRREECELPPAR
jgi:hypothetical protein